MNRKALVGLVGTLAIGSIVALVIWLQQVEPASPPRQDTPDNAAPGVQRPTTEVSLSEQARAKMQSMASSKARMEHLDWVGRQGWATSNAPVLRNAVISDPDESVQLKAVEVALRLARKESSGATDGVVRMALASTKGNTRARGLKEARESPSKALVPDLIEIVDSQDPYASMALNALAFIDDEQAHAKVQGVAADESAKRDVRERAIALLAVTKTREGHELLIQLATGSDERLAKLARTVLDAWLAK